MSAKVRIKEMGNGGRQVIYSGNKTFDLSPTVMQLIEASGGGNIDKFSSEESQDQLISAVKAQVEHSRRQLLELAVYGRVVLEMHPRSLTHVTLGLTADERKAYVGICTQMGKQTQKLAGSR
jgi:hypothetical protein